MFKRIIAIFLILSFIVGSIPSIAFAKTYTSVKAAKVTVVTPKPSPTPVPVVDSFDLFWPMVAGKTMQSKIYFLKSLKEKIRGFFIFGSAQKASYNLFLGIKRMLEAEALIKGNVPDLANKTLESAAGDIDKAKSNIDNAENSGNIDQSTKDEINTRINNLKKFINSLINTAPDYKDKLQSILDKINSIAI